MSRRSSTASSAGARQLHFDAFSGVAGNMVLAALVDLGVPRRVLEDELASLYEAIVRELDVAAEYREQETRRREEERLELEKREKIKAFFANFKLPEDGDSIEPSAEESGED